MILKEKTLQKAASATAKAGQKQEQDVAYYLRRAFKESKQIFVFNDIKFSHHDETAQIDHLILYPYGFILIESKSITGEVTVNTHEEWSRSYNGQWRGMPSPIKQTELQKKLLVDLLESNVEQILGTLLTIQKHLSRRCWDSYCAISSNAIIDREKTTTQIGERLVKSEFIADVVVKKMNIPRFKAQLLNPLSLDSRPCFSKTELENICNFLLENCVQSSYPKQVESSLEVKEPVSSTEEMVSSSNAVENNIEKIQCKKCSEAIQLTASWGKFGYYVKCDICETNTSMKLPCPLCKSKNTKVHKKKEQYSSACADCGENIVIFVQTQIGKKELAD